MPRKPKVPKRPPGRPTLYSEAMLDKIYDYSINYNKPRYGSELIPSHASLCTHLGISRATLSLWIKEENREELINLLALITQIAETQLVQNGLNSSFNATVTKLVLASKHGYIDTQQAQHYQASNIQPIQITFVSAEDNKLINKPKALEHSIGAIEPQTDDTITVSIG